MTDELKRLQNLENLIKTTTNETEKSTLLELKNNMKISLIDKIHPYKISYLETCGRWNTYVKKSTGGRREIKAPTKNELYKKLWKHYGFESITVYTLFWKWFEYAKDFTSSSNTLDRHRQYFQKYLFKSDLLHKNVDEFDGTELSAECNRLVTGFDMTYKTWQNLKSILNGMFEYACKKHFTASNYMSEVKIKVKFRQVTKKEPATEVYNMTEYKDQKRYMYNMFWETRDPVFAQILFQDFSGLRIGELTALRWSDLTEKGLHVTCEEVYDRFGGCDKRRYRVVPHTKTYTDRYVTLPEQATDLLKHLDHSTEFIFSRETTGRITSRQVTYQLEKYAEVKDLQVKRSHKTRKTYASNLAAGGIQLDKIRTQLGHASLKTTLGYIYDTSTDDSATAINACV